MLENSIEIRRLAETALKIPHRLHDYQWEGVSFLYRSQAALLADEMGLGKTVQTAIALALLLNGTNEISRILIVTPASLTLNWIDELAKWAPSVIVGRVQGSARDREAWYLLPIPVLVCSYEQIRADGLDRISSNTFDLVILDEAQRIKNRNSTTALACRLLPRKRAWALSATPIENDESDVESILDFLDPSMGSKYFESNLSKRLSSIMLRRRKSEVRTQLPPLIVQDLKLELLPSQRIKYDEVWSGRENSLFAEVKNQNTILLGLITRLKVICNYDSSTNSSSKLNALRTIVEGAGDTGRVLVFSQFVNTLKWISDRLDTSHELLIGDMSLSERQTAINSFRKGSSPRLLLISIKAGGVGLNLEEATHVVLFDRWWNPATENQAIYRAHRFNRNLPLHVIRFLIENSIESRVAEILDEKEHLFENLIEGSGSTSYHFTKRELLEILDLHSSSSLNLE